MPSIFAQEIMSKEFSYLPGDASVEEVFDACAKNPTGGVIITESSSNKTVTGVVTLFDLLARGSKFYLPTVMAVLKKMPVYGGDEASFKAHFKGVLDLRAKDLMNPNPVTLITNSLGWEAMKLFAENEKLNLILVLNPAGEKLEGIINRQDALRFYYRYSRDISFRPASGGTIESAVEKQKEEKVEEAIEELGKFSLVTKMRTRHWLLLSIVFAIAGALIAWFLIIKVALR